MQYALLRQARRRVAETERAVVARKGAKGA